MTIIPKLFNIIRGLIKSYIIWRQTYHGFKKEETTSGKPSSWAVNPRQFFLGGL